MSEILREQYPNNDRTYAIASGMNRGYEWVEIDINQNTDEHFDESMRSVVMETMGQEAEFAWDAKEAIKHPEATYKLAHTIHPKLEEEREEERRKFIRENEMDELTQIGNRRAFDKARPTADADEQTHFIFLDVVNFKKVNDKIGHETGDTVLKEMATHIKNEAGKEGYGGRVFRVGGDEFVVLLPYDISRYVLGNIIENYGEPDYDGVKTGLRGVVGNTFSEVAAAMTDEKQASKLGHIGRFIRQMSSSFSKK